MANSLLGSYSFPLSNLVGPPNKSPNVPTLSGSETKIDSANPPVKPTAASSVTCPFLFSLANWSTFFWPFLKLSNIGTQSSSKSLN